MPRRGTITTYTVQQEPTIQYGKDLDTATLMKAHFTISSKVSPKNAFVQFVEAAPYSANPESFPIAPHTIYSKWHLSSRSVFVMTAFLAASYVRGVQPRYIPLKHPCRYRLALERCSYCHNPCLPTVYFCCGQPNITTAYFPICSSTHLS